MAIQTWVLAEIFLKIDKVKLPCQGKEVTGSLPRL